VHSGLAAYPDFLVRLPNAGVPLALLFLLPLPPAAGRHGEAHE
jgi:hypothetical protein